MLYDILVPLSREYSILNVFSYITFRAGYALVTALLVSFVLGPFIIKVLRKWQAHETVRDDGPQSHLIKQGTVTMGGIIILMSIVIPTLLWARLDNAFVLITLLSTVWMGAVGFLDDYLKAKRRIREGLVAKYKLAGQITLGIIVGTCMYHYNIGNQEAMRTMLPFFKDYVLNYGSWYLYIPMVTLVITATSNAVNLTDGLDGLAIGLIAIAASAYALICYALGRITTAEYLNVFYIPGLGELTILCLAMVGAALGFLWFNFHPAKIFMGDTGALALGAALGTMALLSRTEIILVIIGGVFVVEVLSVIIQVVSYKLRKKRVFKMAPIHHHYELKGWAEETVVVRFWIVGILLAIIALTTFKIR